MASSYTPLLGLVLPVTGELAGTWGTVWNNEGTGLLDSAIAGTTTLSTDADVTLTTTTGASNQARQAILLCSGARTALRTITAPAQSKIYVVINNTTGGYGVKLVGAGPTTGVTVANGKTAVLVWNGSDFVEVAPATATTATNLAGGAAGSVPYQSGANTTTFLSLGTAAQVLQVNAGATAPEWVSSTGTGNVVRATSPTIATPTFTTSATVPLLIGGTGTTSTLTLRSTSGVGTTGADIIFQTGNNGATEAMRILNSGYVGIGTNAPNATLQVGSGSIAPTLATGITVQHAYTPVVSLLSPSATAATARLTFGNETSKELGIFRYTYSTGELTLQTSGGSTNGNFTFYTNGTLRATIDSSGNVGIGTNAPSALLHISSGNPISLIENTVASSNATLQLKYPSRTWSLAVRGSDLSGAFCIRDTTAPADRLIIDTSGRVLIGATAARTSYAVIPPLQTEALSAGTSGASFTLNSANSEGPNVFMTKTRGTSAGSNTTVVTGDTIGNLYWAAADGTDTVSVVARISAAVEGTVGTAVTPGVLRFATTGAGANFPSERMRIDSSGNVGIGTASPGSKLDVNGNTNITGTLTATSNVSATNSWLFVRGNSVAWPSIVGQVAGRVMVAQSGGNATVVLHDDTAVAANTGPNGVYFTGRSNDTGPAYLPWGALSAYKENASQGDGNGYMQFRVSLNGTGLVERMRIDSSGNLLLGTTSASERLTVSGNIALPAATTEQRYIKVGNGRTGNGFSYIDLIGDATYTTFGLRIIRNDSGANSISDISHRGTGDFYINTVDAAPILLRTSGTTRLRIDANGNVLNISSGGLGYGTGSGGAVTQATSRTTGVTLNKTNGAITLVSAAGTTTWQTFTVTNNTVAATDTVIVNQKSGTDLNEIHVTAVANGSFNISFKTTGGTTTEQPVFNFAVIKAVTA